VFVSIAPAEPLEAVVDELNDVSRQVGYSYPFLDPEIEFAGAYEWEIPANWKVFQENNLECYHCGITHKKTLNTVCKVDGENFVNVNFANGNYIGAPLQEELSEVDPEVAKRVVETVETRDEVPFQQFWLWPTNMITFGLTLGYGVFRIYPVTADSCRMSGRLYARPSELEAPTGLEELLGEVINEDIAVSSGVQLGLRSGVREWGPLHHGREESIEWFSTQVWNHLSGSFRDSREDQAQDAGDGRRLAA
jgi:phenylpropionate dioxygenase-like ring-hydroxylating dioxygenase large terminal subunit